MIFEKLNYNHIKESANLAQMNYEKERLSVDILPNGDYKSLFANFLQAQIPNGLGICAIDNGKVIGFLSCYSPINSLFGTSTGIFSPIYAHGTINDDSGMIYSHLYQKASKVWVDSGILSHTIALYSHDDAAINSFFHNGFGLRCVDAIRELIKIPFKKVANYNYSECEPSDYKAIANLENKTIHHLRSAPMFMPRNPNKDEVTVAKAIKDNNARYFVAKYKDAPVGYIKISDEGENFSCDSPSTKNLCGAYLNFEHRSNHVFTNLLSIVCDTLLGEGFKRLGVDYESFNPTANAFWNKYFTPYTYSVARRIDERIIMK